MMSALQDIKRKHRQPQWFKGVQADKVSGFKQYVKGVVAQKRQAVESLTNDANTTPLAIKEQRRYLAMLIYLHNGNREKYEEFKVKTKETMSEVLSEVMEMKDHTCCFIKDDHVNKVVTHNEGTSLRQANKMKLFQDNLDFWDVSAEFLELFESRGENHPSTMSKGGGKKGK